MPEGFIPPHGGYGKLLSYRKAEIVYDATATFCERFVNKHDRTYDQMIQAARSGKQNIIEGSQASGTSKEMEIKLTNVARASLEELLADFQDFLRIRGITLWDKNSREALYVRRLGRMGKIYRTDRTERTDKTDRTDRTDKNTALSHPPHPSHESHPFHESYETYKLFIETRPPDIVANIIICLIHQANYLLDQQIRSLEKTFVEQGGLRERMTRARLTERDRQKNSIN